MTHSNVNEDLECIRYNGAAFGDLVFVIIGLFVVDFFLIRGSDKVGI